MIKKRAYKWHRFLSAIAAIPLLMWAGSGLMHQAGAWVKPEFKKEAFTVVSGKPMLENLTAIIQNQYQADAVILGVKKIEEFNHHYSKKNKVLPVYEVAVKSENETVFYVDLLGTKIVSGANRDSRAIHTWFGYLHKWSFLESMPVLRVCILLLFSSIIVLSGWLGIYLYFVLPALSKKSVLTPNQVEKLWHRRLGIAVSVFMLLFAFTGFMHAIGDLYPAFKEYEKPFFEQLHMYRFTDSISPTFRFWWIFTLAAMFIVMLGSGLVLFLRLFLRKINP